MTMNRFTADDTPGADDVRNLDESADKLEIEGEDRLVEDDELDLEDADADLPLFDTKGNRHTGGVG